VVAEKDPTRGNGVYGRFDGDLSLALGAGADFGNGTRGALVGRALYYHTLGLVGGYSDALGGDAALTRVVYAAVEIRPLFLLRWSKDRQSGNARFDLALDSLCAELGAFVAQPNRGDIADEAGFQGALGFGVPLLATANGPWLEGRAAYRSGLDDDLAAFALFSFYGSVLTPIVK
jgi:hypothetical protein